MTPQIALAAGLIVTFVLLVFGPALVQAARQGVAAPRPVSPPAASAAAVELSADPLPSGELLQAFQAARVDPGAEAVGKFRRSVDAIALLDELGLEELAEMVRLEALPRLVSPSEAKPPADQAEPEATT